MQFTPQQLAGAQRYGAKTRVGNWLEDMTLEEEKLSDFSRGKLVMNKVMSKDATYNQRVALGCSADGALRFGTKVMFANPASNTALAVDLTEKVHESDAESRLVSAHKAKGPVARNVFEVLPVSEMSQMGDVVHYGEPVFLACHDALLVDARLGGALPSFYLASALKNERNASRVANQQPTFMSARRDSSAVWTLEKVCNHAGVARQLACDEAVPCGDYDKCGDLGFLECVVVQHRGTKQALATNPKFRDATDFGVELEVSCHNYHASSKVGALASEMMGKTTGATNARLEQSLNFWQILVDARGDAQDEADDGDPRRQQRVDSALPKITSNSVVANAAMQLAGLDGALEKLARAGEQSPGFILDREDLAFELRDAGLDLDDFSMKTLLDTFDVNSDGMIPLDHFLRAMTNTSR